MISQAELEALISNPEGRQLECKEARNRFSFDNLARYVAALANEGGGYVLLGVTDRRPRDIVGTAAFPEPGAQAASLFQQLRIRVDTAEFHIGEKRVVVFEVPARPVGQAVSLDGAYWMRAGESLVAMSDDRLREIHQELDSDFSAEICDVLGIDGLDLGAIEEFRKRWIARSGNGRFGSLSALELLQAADLMDSDGQRRWYHVCRAVASRYACRCATASAGRRAHL